MPGGAQQRTGHAQLEAAFLRHDSGALRAPQPDLIAVEQREVLIEPLGHDLEELADLRLPARWDVLEDAAHLEVARVDALAGGHLEQVEHEVAVAAAPPEHRDRADVERARGEGEKVRCDPAELRVDHTQILSARRHLDFQQPLDRHAEHVRVGVVGQVIHPLDERDDLPVLLVLAALLDAGVDVADDRLDVAHDLALERRQQPQHPVRRRMVRPDVDREELVLEVGLGGRRGARDRLRVQPLHRHRALPLAVGH